MIYVGWVVPEQSDIRYGADWFDVIEPAQAVDGSDPGKEDRYPENKTDFLRSCRDEIAAELAWEQIRRNRVGETEAD